MANVGKIRIQVAALVTGFIAMLLIGIALFTSSAQAAAPVSGDQGASNAPAWGTRGSEISVAQLDASCQPNPICHTH